MENINERISSILKPIPSAIFKSSIKINPFKINRNPQRRLTLPTNINHNLELQIVEAMKKTAFSYNSIFLQNNFFLEEPQTLQSVIKKETCETQTNSAQFDRKGYHFFQYQANNPIEDSICHFEIPDLNAFFVSIFDGHGGQELSKFCAKNTREYLEKWMKHSMKLQKYENNKVQLIKDGLRGLHFELQNQFYKIYVKKICEKQQKKIKSVGTCAITAVVWENKCIVANCGDSHAMIISQDRGSYNYFKLSERYSVNSKSERQRLIEQFKGVDENIVIEERKNVFYLKGMLQPTRSIGDYYLKHKEHYMGADEFKGPYISCEPDIRVYDIKQHDKQLLIASDGLWDYLSKWQILKYVIEANRDKAGNRDKVGNMDKANNREKAGDAENETQSETEDQNEPQSLMAANFLVEKILEKVANDLDLDISYIKSLQLGEKRSYHDDITIAIIDLNQFFGEKSTQL